MRSSISGSTAALDNSVTPSASTAVSSTCSVAPTDGYGSRIFVPRSRCGASRYCPSARFSMVAPNCRSTSKWKSMGRPPMSQPPRPGMNAWPRRLAAAGRRRGSGYGWNPRGRRCRPRWRSRRASGPSPARRARHPDGPSPRAAGAGRGRPARHGCPERCAVGSARCPAGGDHGLRHEVLRTADTDLALQRGSAVDKQDIVVDGHESRVPMSWSGAGRSLCAGAGKTG